MKKSRFKYLKLKFIGLFIISALTGYSQWVNDSLTGFYGLKPSDTKRLEFHSHNFQFFRNNEYFTPFQDGETILGARIVPLAQYHTGKGTSIIGGAFIQTNFGEGPINQLTPVFGIRQRLSKYWQVNMGYLDGGWAHKLKEPLLGFENGLRRAVEQGLQFKYEKGRNFFDLWLDWMEFQKRFGTSPERFTLGISSEWYLSDSSKKTDWYCPIQFTAYHRGGQLDTLNQPVYSRLTGLTGVGFKRKGKSKANHWGSEICASFARRPTPGEGPQSGYGFWVHSFAKSGPFEFGITYWNGQDFYSNRGGAIYGVVPEAVSRTTLANVQSRSLIIYRIGYSEPLSKGINIGVRGEYFQDLQRVAESNYNMGFYLSAQIQEIIYSFKN